MIIGIDMGHTLSGAGTGAAGYAKETDKNRQVGKRLITMLQEKGHKVINCTVDKSTNDLADRVRKANAQTLDLFVSLHLNAYRSTTAEMGVETYSLATTGKGREYAIKIQNELVSAVKWKNRGVKTNNYYVLRNTKAPAVLVELGFCDSKADMDKWNTEVIAKALFKGITGATYVAPAPAFSPYTVRINTDVLNVRSGAGATFPITATVKRGEVYTIVEVKNGWGRLKSGAGWISLQYTVRA